MNQSLVSGHLEEAVRMVVVGFDLNFSSLGSAVLEVVVGSQLDYLVQSFPQFSVFSNHFGQKLH